MNAGNDDVQLVCCAGLKDSPGGEQPLILGVNDDLLKRKTRNISRADVAEVCVQALSIPAAFNRSIDVIADATSNGPPTTEKAQFEELFKTMKEDCDYSINDNPVYTPA